MKTIKFRAWQKTEKRFIKHHKIVSLYFIGGNGINEKLDDSPRYRFHNREDIELHQFTGFEDSKNQEIYEQDYVSLYKEISNTTMIGLVIWDKKKGGLTIQKMDPFETEKPDSNKDEDSSEYDFYIGHEPTFQWNELTVIGNTCTGMLQ